jgi:outer membrane protein TolC
MGLVLALGCTAKHYRKSADKEVYGIIQKMDQRVFGKTNAFTINTPYSARDPKTIPPEEIIFSRMVTTQRVINLDQSLDLAVRNSREYQSQKELLYLKALSLTGARYEFSPKFIAESTAQVDGYQNLRRELDPITGEPVGEPLKIRTTQGTVKSKIGVSQLLKTGGRLSLALGNDLLRYFTGKPNFTSRDSAVDVITVDLSQPLLRGFGANSPEVEAFTQTDRDVVYAVRSFSVYQEQFAVDTVTAYFNLLTQKDIVRNNYRDYTNRVETTRYLEARAVDRERRNSVDDARTAELGALRDYINSLASYMRALDNFKLRLGLPLSEEIFLNDTDLDDLMKSGVAPIDLDTAAAFKICLENQLEILNAIDKFEDSKRKVRIAIDRFKPGLNLFANASLPSKGTYDYANFEVDRANYTAGVTLNLPVDRLNERNEYRRTLINFEEQLRSLALVLDTYKERIDNGLRSIEQARLNYLNGVESLKVAERRVENNNMLMEAGRATVRDVREAQDSLIQAQNNLASLYTAYLGARLNLLVSLGVIDIGPDRFWLMDPLQAKLSPAQKGAPPLRMPEDRVVPPESFLEPSS